jgi:hypothetical protein
MYRINLRNDIHLAYKATILFLELQKHYILEERAVIVDFGDSGTRITGQIIYIFRQRKAVLF